MGIKDKIKEKITGKDEENKKPDDKFSFQPSFSGMPYPPFLLNGPHYHPPMNIMINTLPYPNPRAEKFYDIAQNNAQTQAAKYAGINAMLSDFKNVQVSSIADV